MLSPPCNTGNSLSSSSFHSPLLLFRSSPDPMVQIVRSLCDTTMCMLKDWPWQKVREDSFELPRYRMSLRMKMLNLSSQPGLTLSVISSSYSDLGLRGFFLSGSTTTEDSLCRNTDVDSLILLLADALQMMTEQWPGAASFIVSPSFSMVLTIHCRSLPQFLLLFLLLLILLSFVPLITFPLP